MNEALALNLSHKEYLAAEKDYARSAGVVNLVYITDSAEGIERIRKGKGFHYLSGKHKIKQKEEIERINKLAIPPAWENVWICKLSNGHIQATGFDLRKRKQYRYHPLWNLLRNETKFHHLQEFGKSLPQLRIKLKADMARKELSQEKVLATVISLMEHTYIRVGNNGYEKMYGSYGLTTLKNKHVSIQGDKMLFSFKGKKSIQHNISLKNKKLAKIVRQCRDIPGKELFQYYDAEGNHKSIDSGMVNEYIKEATGQDFSAKDFRTWAGSLHALNVLSSIKEDTVETDKKKNIIHMLDEVSKKLGNTRIVCRKYYVHPGIIRLYEEDKLANYLTESENEVTSEDGLNTLELALMEVLKK